jgi:DedD protein
MPFFKFRKKSEESTAHAHAPNSVEAIRQRAKHRLIGASILVLLAVIGFPILFDSQPRPVPIEVVIDIPDKNTVAPLVSKQSPTPGASAVSGRIEDATLAEAPLLPQPSTAPVEAPALPVPLAVAPAKPAPVKKEVATAGRFIVQIGAFAEQTKAREARLKLEKAGFKTYIQMIDTKDGRRIRVRVGPFETKADANKAAEKIKKLDLPAGILEL